jgi:SAM-dependent methyltransferase
MHISAHAHDKGGKVKTMDKEEIKQAVRQRYGNIAQTRTAASKTGPPVSCCDPSPFVAETSRIESCGCPGSDTDQEHISTIMGYSEKDLDSVPEGANLGLGCGNPVALALLEPGETVVDLGSGAGFDCFLASPKVGAEGKIIGIDMTPEMLTKARENIAKTGADNVEFRLGEIEHLPVADNSADVIMSNCVINLSPDKPRVLRDAFRVLKPGGRLAISDIVATAPLPENVRSDLSLVSACVGGAASIDDIKHMLAEAGFENIKIKPKDESRKLVSTWVPGQNIEDFIVSAYIEAQKP